MYTFLRKLRSKTLNKNKIGTYLLYAIGEILLIIIGILIAVGINEREQTKKDNVLRCQYLEELNFNFEYDIKDVKENIRAVEYWNPIIKEVIEATKHQQLTELDSISHKLNVLKEFIFFGQQSKSKIEELKYSNVELIIDRDLKNRILLYQDSEIFFLREIERRYNLFNEELRQYFSKNLLGHTVDWEQLELDNHFFGLARHKYGANNNLKFIYQKMLKEQLEIKELIELELEKECGLTKK